MLKITLEIDNKFACGLSPIRFLEKYIFQYARLAYKNNEDLFITPSAKIKIIKMEQI